MMRSTIHLGLLIGLCLTAPMLSAAEVMITNGDRLSGKIVGESPESITLQHPVLGEIVVPRIQVVDVKYDEGEKPLENTQSAAKVDGGLLNTGFLTDWKRHLEIGLAGSAGKSREQQINAGFTADYEDEQTRWAHRTVYKRSETEGDLADHNLFSTLNRDWLHPGSPWFQFAGGRADWDEFKDWDYRLAVNAGAGYEFIKTDSYRLLGRAGLGGNQTFGGTREEFTPEALLEVDVKWKINDSQLFSFVNTWHPNLEESGEFRNLTSLDWTLDLSKGAGLGLKISLNNEYDSLVEEGFDHNDFNYAASLVWDL